MKKTMREYNDEIQPLRAITFNPETPEGQRVEVDAQLQRLLAEYYKDYPVITGTFTYTQEEAKKAGFVPKDLD